MNKKLDLFGVFIIAFVTSVGGGTLRDVLIGNTPVTWMQESIYMLIIALTVVFAIIFSNHLHHLRRTLFLFDTIGIGLFTLLGIEKGSGEAGTVVAADITIEQAITVAKQKASGLSGADLMAQASEVLGVAKSMGLSSEGKDPKVIQAAMKAGEYSDKF